MADLEERSAQAGLFATAHGAGIEAPRRAGGTAAVDVATAGNGSRNGAGRGRVAPEVAAAAAARSHNGVGLGGALLDGDAVVASGGMARGSGSGDGLLGLLDPLVAGLRALGSEHLEERLQIVGRCEARLAAVRAETVAALARRDSEARAADVLRNDLKQSRGGAKRDVKIAGQLAELPETAEALAEGAITPQHARIIAEASEHTPVDETELLAAAGHEPVDVFARTVRDHVNDRSGDDLEERRKRQRARRQVSLTKQSDGMYKLFGQFDPVAGGRIETALAAAAKKLWHAEDAKQRATPAQRFADALEMLITRNRAGKTQGTTLLVIADTHNGWARGLGRV